MAFFKLYAKPACLSNISRPLLVLMLFFHYTVKTMKAIITVVGGDKVGIIAKVSSFLASHSINIADITQTVLSGNFVMMMMADFESADISIDAARTALVQEAKTLGVEVNIMNEKVFSEMHRI